MLLNFYLVPQPNKALEEPIRLSITINKVRLMTSIGYSVLPAKWNKGKQKVKDGYENSKHQTTEEINARLEEIEKLYKEYAKTAPEHPTTADLKKVLNMKLKPTARVKRENMMRYFDQFLREESAANQWSDGTIEGLNAFRKHLETHCGHKPLSYFDDEGVARFVRYFRVDCNMSEVSVRKYFKMIRWFVRWAERKRLITPDLTFKNKPKLKVLEQPVIFLTKEELLKVYNCVIPANGTKVKLHRYDGEEYEKLVEDAAGWVKARDLFCFCAFTSLRYSDMAKVKRNDVVGDILYVTTQKTNDRLPINLNSFAKAILDKYKDCDFPDDLALPVITNQRMNDYIKNVCEICEINEPITKIFYQGGERQEETHPKYALIGTHAGRRTFICFALASGIPPQVVMKWTGHSDYKAMKPYIEIAEKTKAEQMKVFEQSLSK